MKVKAVDLGGEFSRDMEEYVQAATRIFERGAFIMGEEVAAFEQEFARYAQASYAIGVNSGTDALVIALRSLGIGPGDEVLVPGFTFLAAAEAVASVGASIRFVDVDVDTFNVRPENLRTAASGRTRGLIVVHLFGLAADIESIVEEANRNDWMVVEDCAHAAGLRIGGGHVGTFGHAGAFSFFPTKNLGAAGDAGLILTNDERVAALSKQLRVHGMHPKYWSQRVGYNSRLDEIQAAVLRLRLRQLDMRNQSRREVAAEYRRQLTGLTGVILPPNYPHHIYHQFTIRVPSGRDDLVAWLTKKEVEAHVYYPHPLNEMPAFDLSQERPTELAVARQLAAEVVSLPVRADMSEEEIAYVANAIRDFLGSANR